MLYNIIYSFFLDNFFTSGYLVGHHAVVLDKDISFSEWLSHSFTIIVLTLIICFFIFLTKWLFKFAAGLFKW